MKPLIGITQRVEEIKSYGERRDCLDQQWSKLVEVLGGIPLPLANCVDDVAGYVQGLGLSAVIMSGGNDLADLSDCSNPAPERDAFEMALLNYSEKASLPVLGVCRGMQVINAYCGGELINVSGHVAQRHPLDDCDVRLQYSDVNSFHNRGIVQSGLGAGLRPLAYSEDGHIEAFEHGSFNWTGIMWHPERETPFNDVDLQFISEALKLR